MDLFCCDLVFEPLVNWAKEVPVILLMLLVLFPGPCPGHAHLGLYRLPFHRGLRVVAHVHLDHL